MNLYKFNHIPLFKNYAQLLKKKKVTKNQKEKKKLSPKFINKYLKKSKEKRKKKRLLLGKLKKREGERGIG